MKDVLKIKNDLDSFAINDLEDNFGFEIEDELFGIDITDLKNVAIVDLASAVSNKFSAISASELRGIEGIDFMYLTDADVVRHPLVQRIVKAYEEKNAERERSSKRRNIK